MNKYDELSLSGIVAQQDSALDELIEIKSKYFMGEDYCTSELVDDYVNYYYKYLKTLTDIVNQLDADGIVEFTKNSPLKIGNNLQSSTIGLNEILYNKCPSVVMVTSLIKNYCDALSYKYVLYSLKINGSLPQNKLCVIDDHYGKVKMSSANYQKLCNSVEAILAGNNNQAAPASR